MTAATALPIRALNAHAGGNAVRAFCFALSGTEAPEWIPYLPVPDAKGRITGEDGRSWTIRDARALCAGVKRKLPIDINHATDLQGKHGREAPAVGWIGELQVRDDGSIWAKASWTTRGLNALQGQEYGFISPFFDHDKAGVITRLAGASLVNEPNFESMPALNGRQQEEAPMIEALLALLGLAKTATQDEAERAINTLKSDRDRALNARDTPDLQRFVPRTDFDAQKQRADNFEQKLKDRDQADTDAQIDTRIKAALQAGKITPASEPYHRANCAREGGLKAFEDYVAAQPVIVSEADRQTRPDGGGNGQLTANQRAICRQLGMSEPDYLKQLQANAA